MNLRFDSMKQRFGLGEAAASKVEPEALKQQVGRRRRLIARCFQRGVDEVIDPVPRSVPQGSADVCPVGSRQRMAGSGGGALQERLGFCSRLYDGGGRASEVVIQRCLIGIGSSYSKRITGARERNSRTCETLVHRLVEFARGQVNYDAAARPIV